MRRAFALMFAIALLLTPALAQDVIEVRHTHYPVNVRSGPGLHFNFVGWVDSCDYLNVMSVANRWYEIQFFEGTAFIASWYTAKGEPHCSAAKAAASNQISWTNGSPRACPTNGVEPTTTNFTGNQCYENWDCGLGDTPDSLFMWKRGWCSASVEAGVQWTVEECEIELGLRPATEKSEASNSSAADDDDDDEDDEDDGLLVCPFDTVYGGDIVTRLSDCDKPSWMR